MRGVMRCVVLSSAEVLEEVPSATHQSPSGMFSILGLKQ